VPQFETAQYIWDLGAAYRQCALLSKKFKTYNWMCHNCRDFSSSFHKILQKNGESEQKAITGDWSQDKLVELAVQVGVPFHLTDDAHITKLFRHSGFWILRRVLEKGVNLT
jgi:hypothetical protein